MTAPLQNVRVVEIGRYIAAPYAGAVLGDLGADVIKVEDPAGGDPMRRWQSAGRPYSPQFAIYNRNKRGVALDLRTDAGRAAYLSLCDSSDVVLENFRPGVADRLGVGWDVLAARNARLLYARITGFGPTGPYAQRAAFDTIISAYSGLYSQLLDLEAPRPVGPAFSDLLSGLFSVIGVLAALEQRRSTGRGQLIDTSMLGAVLGLLTEPASVFLDTAEVTVADTRQRRAQAYACLDRDGRPFVVHLSVPEKFWVALTDVIGRPELRDDPRFATRQDRYDNYLELDAQLKDAMRHRTRDEWSVLLEERDVPHAPILRYDEVFDDPQVQAMDLVAETAVGDDVMRMVRPPLRFSDGIGADPRRAPTLGEHTAEVLHEAGCDQDAIAAVLPPT